MNSELHRLYASRFGRLMDRLSGVDGVSNPHLIKVPHEYQLAAVKLLVVGQQTFGWGLLGQGLGPDPVTILMDSYEEFGLGRDYVTSPFWLAAHEIYRGLNPEGPEGGFVWTNLIKVDRYHERPDQAVEEASHEVFGVLPEEIAILKPDVVIFFTGPSYDSRLRATFKDVRFAAASDVGLRTMARLEHPHLPRRSFRVYHPKFLRLSGQWNVVSKVIELARVDHI